MGMKHSFKTLGFLALIGHLSPKYKTPRRLISSGGFFISRRMGYRHIRHTIKKIILDRYSRSFREMGFSGSEDLDLKSSYTGSSFSPECGAYYSVLI